MKYGKLEIDLSNWPTTEVITIEVDGKTYRREGECTRCGECCRAFRGPARYRLEDGQCRELHFETDGSGQTLSFCDVYWDRPMSCMLYPFDPTETLPDKCTYTFIEVTDGR